MFKANNKSLIKSRRFYQELSKQETASGNDFV